MKIQGGIIFYEIENNLTKNKNFSLPDCTVGFGIAPNLPKRLAGFNRRWRISLRPEIF